MDNLHVVLSDVAAGRICLRTSIKYEVASIASGTGAFDFGGGIFAILANSAFSGSEADRRSVTHIRNFSLAVGDRGRTVFPVVSNGAIDATLVQSDVSRTLTLPSVFPFQFRVAVGFAELPVCV